MASNARRTITRDRVDGVLAGRAVNCTVELSTPNKNGNWWSWFTCDGLPRQRSVLMNDGKLHMFEMLDDRRDVGPRSSRARERAPIQPLAKREPPSHDPANRRGRRMKAARRTVLPLFRLPPRVYLSVTNPNAESFGIRISPISPISHFAHL